MAMPVQLRHAVDRDTDAIVQLMSEAFGQTEGEVIATLTGALLQDPTAEPRLSIVATRGERIVGHILFTKVDLQDSPGLIRGRILAPLAVHPDLQRRGIGGRLIAYSLDALTRQSVDLVFVLGHPSYYRKFGFIPAGPQGYHAPYPIAAEHTEAWMVHRLSDACDEHRPGMIRCAHALQDRRHWCA